MRLLLSTSPILCVIALLPLEMADVAPAHVVPARQRSKLDARRTERYVLRRRVAVNLVIRFPVQRDSGISYER